MPLFSYKEICQHTVWHKQLKWRTKACLALVWPQHKAKSPGLINTFKNKLKGKKRKPTFMQRLILKLSKVSSNLFQRSLRKVPSAKILFQALFPSYPRGEIWETESKSVFPSGTIFCYSIEVRQSDNEDMNSISNF